LIKVARDRLGGVEKVRTPTGETIVFSSRARTLVDAVYDWLLFDSLPEAYDWIRNELAAGRVTADEVVRAVHFGNMGTIRRIGVILDRLGASRASVSRDCENPIGFHAARSGPCRKALGGRHERLTGS
jgi:hypothetical protein